MVPVPPAAPVARPVGLDHVALSVRDQARSVAWYRDVLGLERLHEKVWGDVPAMMAAPDGSGVALFQAKDRAAPFARAPGAGLRHVAFRVDGAAFTRAKTELSRRGVAFEEMDHAVARSVYFEDPDGHEIELTTYEL